MRVKDPGELRRWRQRRSLSQRDLAYLCKCSQAAISLLERGGMTSLSDDLALTLSARLQVPWETLFDPADPADPADPPGQAGDALSSDGSAPSSAAGSSPTDSSSPAEAGRPGRLLDVGADTDTDAPVR
jgi:transcriptional regulator with XRE-family HTH domain